MRSTMIFEDFARDSWRDFVHGLDFEVRTGALADVRPFAARSGEHVIKIAATLQRIEDPERPTIARWAVDFARNIAWWHLMEAKAAFGAPPLELQIQRNANELHRYLNERAMLTGSPGVLRTVVERCGPRSIRNADQLDIALSCLARCGQASIAMERGRQMIYVPMPRWAQCLPLQSGPMLQ
jgi:hypothetical protein